MKRASFTVIRIDERIKNIEDKGWRQNFSQKEVLFSVPDLCVFLTFRLFISTSPTRPFSINTVVDRINGQINGKDFTFYNGRQLVPPKQYNKNTFFLFLNEGGR